MTLVDSYPQNGFLDFYIDENLWIKFDVEISDSYLSNTYIRLTDVDGNTRVGLSYSKDSSDPTKVILIPLIGNLAEENDYTLQIKSDVTSTTGDPIDQAYLISFETAATTAPSSYPDDDLVIDSSTDGTSSTTLPGGNPSLPSSGSIDSEEQFRIISVTPKDMTLESSEAAGNYVLNISLTMSEDVSTVDPNYILVSILPEIPFTSAVQIDSLDTTIVNITINSSTAFMSDSILSLIVGKEAITNSNGDNIDDDYYLDFIIDVNLIDILYLRRRYNSESYAYIISLISMALHRVYKMGYKLSDIDPHLLMEYFLCVIEETLGESGLPGNLQSFSLGDLNVNFKRSKTTIGANSSTPCLDKLLMGSDLDGAFAIADGIKSGRTYRYPGWRREMLINPKVNIFDDRYKSSVMMDDFITPDDLE